MANLEPADDSSVISDGEIIFPEIPTFDINKDFWSYIYTGDSNEETILSSLYIMLYITLYNLHYIRNQNDCSLWFELRKPRINSSICHRIFISQKNFDTLCTEIINPCDFEDLPAKVKEALNHGKKFESRARELYIGVMRLKLRHFVLVCETGLVIQPSLLWLAASSDGLAANQTSDEKLHTKRHMLPIELVQKKAHSTGYYSQIQLAMGYSGFDTCDFVVYTFKGLIIVRTEFDVSYFDSLIQKLNSFYKKIMLSRIVSSLTN